MRATGTRQAGAVQPAHDHLDELLDQALAASFPASDPVAIDFSSPRDRNEREEGEKR